MIDDGKDIEVNVISVYRLYIFCRRAEGTFEKKQIEVMCPNRESEAVE